MSVFNRCVRLSIPPSAECCCDLVSRSEKSMMGWGGATTSLQLSSRSLHLIVLPACLHRFFGGGAVRGGVTGRPGIPEYWYFAFFSEGFRIYKTTNKSKMSTSHWPSVAVRKYKYIKIYTCTSNCRKKHDLKIQSYSN